MRDRLSSSGQSPRGGGAAAPIYLIVLFIRTIRVIRFRMTTPKKVCGSRLRFLRFLLFTILQRRKSAAAGAAGLVEPV